MKKYKKIAYILLSVFLLLSGFFIYKVSGQNENSENEMNKCLASIKQIETKFTSLFNEFNNISFDNYKILEVEVSQENENNPENQQNSGSQKNSNSSNENSNGSKSSQGNTENKEKIKKYNLENNGILTSNQEPDWNRIKSDVENIYTFIYSNLIDLYKKEENQKFVIDFNKEYDNLTRAVKEENKRDALGELSTLYDYLPIFIENCTNSSKDKNIIKTKSYIFKAYSLLEQDDWDGIYDNVSNASVEFTKLVTNLDDKENLNQYNVNKIYIMINELQNAVILRDKEVFLIKYKNILEEIQNL